MQLKLVQIRKKLGFRQGEIAQKLNTTQAAISRLENNYGSTVTLSNLERHAEIYGCRVRDLISERNNPVVVLGEIGPDWKIKSYADDLSLCRLAYTELDGPPGRRFGWCFNSQTISGDRLGDVLITKEDFRPSGSIKEAPEGGWRPSVVETNDGIRMFGVPALSGDSDWFIREGWGANTASFSLHAGVHRIWQVAAFLISGLISDKSDGLVPVPDKAPWLSPL